MLLAVALVISFGLAFKAHRYAGQFEDRDAENLARIAVVAAAGGWTPIEATGVKLPFVHATFAKPGCATQLRIAPLGDSRELVAEVQLAFGPDVGFVETGVASGGRGFSLLRLFAPDRKSLGRIAISPAPADGPAACRAPSAGQWRGA